MAKKSSFVFKKQKTVKCVYEAFTNTNTHFSIPIRFRKMKGAQALSQNAQYQRPHTVAQIAANRSKKDEQIARKKSAKPVV